MSKSTTIAQPDDDPEQNSVRVQKFADRLKELTDAKGLAEFLYLNRKLSREEYDQKVIEFGYRAALKQLAGEACNGDIKALDLFLKRCDLHFSQVRKPAKEDDSKPSPSYKPRDPQ